ncbi:MAG: AhpC/TSA family protein, partial [Burkholderiales bacterium]|nr:AhpC/TSA family protein [Burkholderiales bacterium]
PAALKINIDQRAALVEQADPSAWIKAGDRVEPFTLLDVEGGELTLKDLTARGPAVLVFFRFAGCPACNIALPYYERALQPTLKALGVPLVAVSPQIPERLGEIRVRHGLSFKVASDPGNTLGRRFRIPRQGRFDRRDHRDRNLGTAAADRGGDRPRPGRALRRRQPRLAGAHRGRTGDRRRPVPGGGSSAGVTALAGRSLRAALRRSAP